MTGMHFVQCNKVEVSNLVRIHKALFIQLHKEIGATHKESRGRGRYSAASDARCGRRWRSSPRN